MKKIIFTMLFLITCFTLCACNNNNNSSTPSQESQEENLSGINSQVSTSPEKSGTKYTFEDFFSTVLPAGVKAEDRSINNDAGFFTIYDDSQTYMDITYYTTGTSEEAQASKAKETASTGSASAADNIAIQGVTFYGVNMPDYGKIQYMGFVNGYNIDISVYTDINNEVVQSFFENTQFIRQ